MGNPSKNGRKKNLWDIAATIRVLDYDLGDEVDPQASNPPQSFLHFARALCRDLQANLPAIEAFDRLFRLMHDRSGPIRRYAREVFDAFAAYQPLAPRLHVLLQGGASDQLWNLWFFACEMPRRLHSVMVDVDRLLFAGSTLMPAPFDAPGFQLTAARASILLGLKGHGFSVPAITAVMDPAGLAENRKVAQARIRQELSRLQKTARRLLAERGT